MGPSRGEATGEQASGHAGVRAMAMVEQSVHEGRSQAAVLSKSRAPDHSRCKTAGIDEHHILTFLQAQICKGYQKGATEDVPGALWIRSGEPGNQQIWHMADLLMQLPTQPFLRAFIGLQVASEETPASGCHDRRIVIPELQQPALLLFQYGDRDTDGQAVRFGNDTEHGAMGVARIELA